MSRQVTYLGDLWVSILEQVDKRHERVREQKAAQANREKRTQASLEGAFALVIDSNALSESIERDE